MAAKGAILKQQIIEQILQTFSGRSFLYNDGKEIRINGSENGEPLQIKITLTTAKTAVVDEEASLTQEEISFSDNMALPTEKIQSICEPTEEEKKRLATLLEKLGLNGA